MVIVRRKGDGEVVTPPWPLAVNKVRVRVESQPSHRKATLLPSHMRPKMGTKANIYYNPEHSTESEA